MRLAAIALATHLGAAAWQPAAAVGDTVPGAAVQADEPLLPRNYRRLIAAALLRQYLSDGDGPAEISQPHEVGLFRKTPTLIVRYRLSRTGAHGMLLTFQDPPPQRYRCIEVEADRAFFSGSRTLSFKHPRIDPGQSCAEDVDFEPFAELQQLAAKALVCRQRRDAQCAD